MILEIELYGCKWAVRTDDPLSTSLFETDGTLCSGKTNPFTKEIVIASGLNSDELEVTIRHELTHAIIKQMLMNKQEFTQEEVCRFNERYGGYIHEKTIYVLNEICERQRWDCEIRTE